MGETVLSASQIVSFPILKLLNFVQIDKGAKIGYSVGVRGCVCRIVLSRPSFSHAMKDFLKPYHKCGPL